jgi:L-serine/L-threonine ammonia-lyase
MSLRTPLHQRTPCFPSPALSTPEREVWLKMECCQPAGSFKIRGIGALCRDYALRGYGELVASSGGNAGYAAAWAARGLGVALTVGVPETTPDSVRASLERLGATVRTAGADWQACHEWALAEAEARGAGYVHPFDHPLIWEGHATLVEETVAAFAAADAPAPDDVLVAVGGGGLLAGVLRGLERFARSAVSWQPRVWAVETPGTASMAAALQAGMPVALDAVSGRARSLGARRVADGAFALARQHGVRSLIVEDEVALRAAERFGREHRHAVEVATGAALAALDAPGVAREGRVLVVVCGGLDAVPFGAAPA